jgi:hypothetical protein
VEQEQTSETRPGMINAVWLSLWLVQSKLQRRRIEALNFVEERLISLAEKEQQIHDFAIEKYQQNNSRCIVDENFEQREISGSYAFFHGNYSV